MDIERDTTVISSMVGNGKSPQEMAHFTGNIIELPFGKRLQFVTENGHRNSEFSPLIAWRFSSSLCDSLPEGNCLGFKACHVSITSGYRT